MSAKKLFPPIKIEVEERHNVKKWHADFAFAVVMDQRNQISNMLVDAGEDARELVCTIRGAYGSILRATYVENKPKIRDLLKVYMDEPYFKQCFEEEKLRLSDMWQPSPYINRMCPAAEQLVRDFYTQDPIKYPLSAEELAQLHLK